MDRKREVVRALMDIKTDLDRLVKHHEDYRRSAEGVASFVPGGSVVSAAISGAGRSASPPQGVAGPMSQTSQRDPRFLRLQNEMQNASRHFQTVANVLRAKHESVMSAVNNMR